MGTVAPRPGSASRRERAVRAWPARREARGRGGGGEEEEEEAGRSRRARPRRRRPCPHGD